MRPGPFLRKACIDFVVVATRPFLKEVFDFVVAARLFLKEIVDFVVAAFIVCRGRVLFVLHRELEKWLPIGGHIHPDEDPEQALYREIDEECGLQVEVLATKPDVPSDGTKWLMTPSLMDIHKIRLGHHHVGLVYFARSAIDNICLNESEHREARWLSLEDLEKPAYDLSAALKYYAQEALRRAAEE